MKTRNQAIKAARAQVSSVSPFGDGYRYSVYSPRHRAWVESTPSNYWSALASRSQSLIDVAREEMGLPPAQYDGGAWTDYIPKIELQIQLFTGEDGERFASVRCTKSGNGADFYESGQEVGWMDGNSLFLNCDWLTIAQARKLAARAIKAAGPSTYKGWRFDRATGKLSHPCGFLTSWLRRDGFGRWVMYEAAATSYPTGLFHWINRAGKEEA